MVHLRLFDETIADAKSDEVVVAAAAALDAQYAVTDLAVKAIASETPKRGFPLNKINLSVLRRRCYEAKQAGSVNIAVDINLLIELMNGTVHGMDNGFTSELTV